jgi:hypothetical protein
VFCLRDSLQISAEGVEAFVGGLVSEGPPWWR